MKDLQMTDLDYSRTNLSGTAGAGKGSHFISVTKTARDIFGPSFRRISMHQLRDAVDEMAGRQAA